MATATVFTADPDGFPLDRGGGEDPNTSTASERRVPAHEQVVRHSDREWPTVEISVTAANGGIRQRVTDTGSGIPEMKSNVVTETGGIGSIYLGDELGQWLDWLAVRRSGGTRSCANEPRGNVVTVTLDQHQPAATALPPTLGGGRHGE